MPAWFVVRTVVLEDDRAAFDEWYAREHLPDALRAFGARRGWRAWSRTDPSVHSAFYEFDSVQAAESATTPQKLRPLVAEFDRHWGSRVTRAREILQVMDER